MIQNDVVSPTLNTNEASLGIATVGIAFHQDPSHSTMSLHAKPAAFALVSEFSPRVAYATYLHSAEYAVETCSSICLSVTLGYCTSTWLNLSFIKQG